MPLFKNNLANFINHKKMHENRSENGPAKVYVKKMNNGIKF